MKKIVDLHIKPVKKEPFVQLTEMKLLEDFGPEGDAYAGPGDRQVTLLGEEDIAALNTDIDKGMCIRKFIPNITVSGSTAVLKKDQTYNLGNAVIRISMTSKKCYEECLIRCEENRICRLPATARFATILNGGVIRINDVIAES